MERISLSTLPPIFKLMVALVTALMVLVTLWVAFIYYVSEGMYTKEEAVPLYLKEEAKEILEEDPDAVHQPVWDSNQVGLEEHLDTAALAQRLYEYWQEQQAEADSSDAWRTQLRRNVGLAHTHINGQTLLFFVMSLFFVLSVASTRTKKIWLWIFAAAVVCHAIGLSGQTFGWFYDDLLVLSGLTIVVSMLYMAYWTFVSLGRSAEGKVEK